MNSNAARIARIYTAQRGALSEDNSPNGGPGGRANDFDLIVQLEAGAVLGDSGASYTLNFTAINDNTAAPEAGLVPAGNPFNEQFKDPEWKPSGTDFVRTGTGEPVGILRFIIPVGASRGRFHYNLDFTTPPNFEVVEIGESNAFILV